MEKDKLLIFANQIFFHPYSSSGLCELYMIVWKEKVNYNVR